MVGATVGGWDGEGWCEGDKLPVSRATRIRHSCVSVSVFERECVCVCVCVCVYLENNLWLTKKEETLGPKRKDNEKRVKSCEKNYKNVFSKLAK